MPRVNVYVKPDDMALWEEAKKLAGSEDSLSGLVTEALRDFVGRREAEKRYGLQMRPYDLPVSVVDLPGETKVLERVRFVGALVASRIWPYDEDDEHQPNYQIYLTKGGKLILYVKFADKPVTGQYQTFDSLDALMKKWGDKLDKDLLEDVRLALQEEKVITID